MPAETTAKREAGVDLARAFALLLLVMPVSVALNLVPENRLHWLGSVPPAARTGPLAGHGGPGLPTPFAHRAYRVQPPGAPPTYPPHVLGPWTPVTTSSSVAKGPVVATNEAPEPTETDSLVEMDGTREGMPQAPGNLI